MCTGAERPLKPGLTPRDRAALAARRPAAARHVTPPHGDAVTRHPAPAPLRRARNARSRARSSRADEASLRVELKVVPCTYPNACYDKSSIAYCP